jgi:hypothetical protein
MGQFRRCPGLSSESLDGMDVSEWFREKVAISPSNRSLSSLQRLLSLVSYRQHPIAAASTSSQDQLTALLLFLYLCLHLHGLPQTGKRELLRLAAVPPPLLYQLPTTTIDQLPTTAACLPTRSRLVTASFCPRASIAPTAYITRLPGQHTLAR